MKYIIRKGTGGIGSNIKLYSEDRELIATFADTLLGRKALGLMVSAVATSGTDTVYDTRTSQYLVGTLDQLIAA